MIATRTSFVLLHYSLVFFQVLASIICHCNTNIDNVFLGSLLHLKQPKYSSLYWFFCHFETHSLKNFVFYLFFILHSRFFFFLVFSSFSPLSLIIALFSSNAADASIFFYYFFCFHVKILHSFFLFFYF